MLFNISKDTMVVTSKYVTEEGFPILCVSHQQDPEEGDIWQFHSGNGDYDMAKMQLVRLGTILALDPTLLDLGSLPPGFEARRESQSANWEIGRETPTG